MREKIVDRKIIDNQLMYTFESGITIPADIMETFNEMVIAFSNGDWEWLGELRQTCQGKQFVESINGTMEEALE